MKKLIYVVLAVVICISIEANLPVEPLEWECPNAYEEEITPETVDPEPDEF